MALQFQGAPDWLLQEYMNRKSPVQEGLDSAAQIANIYSKYRDQNETRRQNEAKSQNEAVDSYIKAYEAGGPELAMDVAQRRGLKNPPQFAARGPQQAPMVDPNAPTPVEDAAQQSLPAEHPMPQPGGPMSPILMASLQSGHGNPLGIQMPDAGLMDQGKYGQRIYDRQLKTQQAQALYGPKETLSPQAALEAGSYDPMTQKVVNTGREEVTYKDPTTGQMMVYRKGSQGQDAFQLPGAGGQTPSAPPNALQTKLNPNEYQMYMKDRGDFDNDSVVKGERTILSSMGKLEQMVANYNPATTPVLRSQAARAIAGEVGVLTEGDIARQFDPSVLARMKRFASIAATGELPEQDLADMRQLIQAAKTGAQGRIGTVARDYGSRLSRNVGGKVSADEFVSNMNLPTQFTPTQIGGSGGGLDPAKKARLEQLRAKQQAGTLR